VTQPLISIITPAFNVERYLALTCNSIRAQTHANWRWLIVNDGSKDQTLAIAQAAAAQEPRITVIDKANSGTADTRNLALAKLPKETAYVIFMDADDLFSADALASLLAAAQKHPECIGAHGIADYIDAAGNPLRPGEFAAYCRARSAVQGTAIAPLAAGEPTGLSALLVKAFHPPGVFIIRRDIVDQVGPYDKETSPQEDWDFWLRAARHGSFHFLDQLILYYRKHDTNSSLNFAKSYAKAHYVRYKTFHSTENTPEQKDLLKRYYRAWQLHKIHEKRRDIRAALKGFHLPRVARLTAHIAAHSLLYMRGHPSVSN
jgi:glycosyltransferase involved in cell wall biosynthesis